MSLSKGDYIDWNDVNDSIMQTDSPAWLANANTMTFSAYDGAFAFRNSHGSTIPMVVYATGNVGIGTTSPMANLDVKSSTDHRLITGPALTLASGMRLESINDAGNSDKGFEFRGSEFTWTDSGTERMRIQATTGNVGIGATNPTYLLDVQGAGGAQMRVHGPAGTATGPGILLTNSTPSNVGFLGSYAAWLGSGTSRDLALAAYGTKNLTFGTNAVERLRIDSAGNLGIGTTVTTPGIVYAVQTSAPSSTIRADNQHASFTGTVITSVVTRGASSAFRFLDFYSDAGSDLKAYIRGDGQAYIDGAWNGGGADYAEFVKPQLGTTPKDYAKGSLICINTAAPDTYKLCNKALDEHLVGIVSTEPGVVGNSPALDSSTTPREKDHILLSMIGRVPAKVNLEGGPIHTGDRIAQSSKPGYGMKAPANVRTVGIALGEFDGKGISDTVTVYLQPEQSFSGLAADVQGLKAANDNFRIQLKATNDSYTQLKEEVEALKRAGGRR